MQSIFEVPRYQQKGIIDNIIEIEGGSVDDPDDLGGKTGRGGITMTLLEEYRHLWAKHGFKGDYKDVPYSLVYEIYTIHFWKRMGLDYIWKINPLIADTMFNWAINSGTVRPVECLQRVVTLSNNQGTHYPDIKADGYWGRLSREGLSNYMDRYRSRRGVERILNSLYAGQWEFYSDITEAREKNEKFYIGWQNRMFHTLDDMRRYAM